MIRVLQFVDVYNRYDFIDVIIQHADPARFQIGICLRSERSNIATPILNPQTPCWLLRGLSRWSIPYTAWRLAIVLRKWNAHILHTHHYDQAVIGWLATRIYPATHFVLGRHYSDSIYRLGSETKRRVFMAIEQATNRAARRIIVPSQYIVDILTERQCIDPEKIDLIPYGFEAKKYSQPPPAEVQRIREEFRLNKCFSIGNFSRLHEEKGHRYLIQAAAVLKERLPNITYLLAGEGPERAPLERQICAAGLQKRMHLLGHRRDAMTLMAAVDAVVQPTLQEAFSQVMVEAMWMRKPLVMSDVSGARDIVRDGYNGLLIPRADVNALVDAIERLEKDYELRQRLGEAAHTFVAEHLTVDKTIPRYEECYLRLMGT
jgi:glycosyltransferase involved in cell wall biosynthesis